MKNNKIEKDIKKFIKKYPSAILIFSVSGPDRPLTITETIAALEAAKYEKILEWKTLKLLNVKNKE